MNDYPEHERMKEILDDRDTVQHFLDWLLDEQDMTLAVYGKPRSYYGERNEDDLTNLSKLYDLREGKHPIAGTYRGHGLREKILAAYFNIDLDLISAEKDQMLKDLRALDD